jgi:hypothetical protein
MKRESLLSENFERVPWRGWGSIFNKLGLMIFFLFGIMMGGLALWTPSEIGLFRSIAIVGFSFGLISIVLDLIGKLRGEPRTAIRSVIVEEVEG